MSKHKAQIIETLGKSYRVLSDVPAWNTPTKVKCLKHNEIFTSRADTLKIGRVGCSQCKSERYLKSRIKWVKTKEYKDFIERQRSRNSKSLATHRRDLADKPHIKLLSMARCIGSFECRTCSTTWKARLDAVKSSVIGCPTCRRLHQSAIKRKDHSELKTNDPKYKKTWSDIANLTNKVFDRYKTHIPNHRKRGKTHHLDHTYTIRDYYFNPKNLSRPVTLLELCHPANFQILPASENISKNGTSWITATELRAKIREWNKHYGKPFKTVKGIVYVV